MKAFFPLLLVAQICLIGGPLLSDEFSEIIWEAPPDVIEMEAGSKTYDFYVTAIATGRPMQGSRRSKDTYIVTELTYYSPQTKERILSEHQKIQEKRQKLDEMDEELAKPSLSLDQKRYLSERRAALAMGLMSSRVDTEPDAEFLIALSAIEPIGSDDAKTVIGQPLNWKYSWDHLNTTKPEDWVLFEKVYEWAGLVEEGDAGVKKEVGVIRYPADDATVEMEIKDVRGVDTATFNVFWNGEPIVKGLSPDLVFFFLNGHLLRKPIVNYINNRIAEREAAEKAEAEDRKRRKSRFQ